MESRNNAQSIRAKDMATKQLGTYFRNSRSAFYVGTMTERYAFINHFNFLSIESFITEAV
jgi:hypothetical protein